MPDGSTKVGDGSKDIRTKDVGDLNVFDLPLRHPKCAQALLGDKHPKKAQYYTGERVSRSVSRPESYWLIEGVELATLESRTHSLV